MSYLSKRWLYVVAGASIALAILCSALAGFVRERQEQQAIQHERKIGETIQAEGLAPNLNELIQQTDKPMGWVSTFVTEHIPGELPWHWRESEILAAYPPTVIGKEPMEALNDLRVGNSITTYSAPLTFKAPNGMSYVVSAQYQEVPLSAGSRVLAIFAAAVAWFALAGGVYMEAAQRGAASPLGWLLLALLTGPLALAVWIIARPREAAAKPAPSAPEAPPCPGCGRDTIPGKAFCVHCGFSLKPLCPECHEPVQHSWAHCGDCGASLK